MICWSEKAETDSVYQLKYAIFDSVEQKFSQPVTIPVSAGLSTSPESMGKVAFKSDNTVIAVFARPFKNEKNPFAGAIYFSTSSNDGKNWSAPQFLHSDTTHAYGRSFFDIARLNNGEVAAIWLDGRFGKTITGSSLFFSRTEKGKGFGRDICLYKGTCECCRTDLLTDNKGNIHIAYRSILFPVALLGKQARDMEYSFSKDNGATFSIAKAISNDNWAIEGCPHTGPSLAINNKGVNAVWYTAGGKPGIYYTSAPAIDASFQNRRLLSSSGKHPQLVTFANGELAMVCEEVMESGQEHHSSKKHSMENMKKSHATAGNARITLTMINNGSDDKKIDVTSGEKADHHAVIESIGDQLLIAWVREENVRSTICYTLVNRN